MDFEIGNWYTYTPKPEMVLMCETCGANIWHVVYGRIIEYVGIENEVGYFKHVIPFPCPGCSRWFFFHTLKTAIDVTREFEALKKS